MILLLPLAYIVLKVILGTPIGRNRGLEAVAAAAAIVATS
jgi:hypothetical protein